MGAVHGPKCRHSARALSQPGRDLDHERDSDQRISSFGVKVGLTSLSINVDAASTNADWNVSTCLTCLPIPLKLAQTPNHTPKNQTA